ncbi:hypothetical protein T439DRAFT_376961 [Meredithblackwellia eburnea MCA 4105]
MLAVPIVVVTHHFDSEKDAFAAAGAQSGGAAAGAGSGKPNWRDRLDTIAPSPRRTSLPRIRPPLFLVALLTFFLLAAARTSSPIPVVVPVVPLRNLADHSSSLSSNAGLTMEEGGFNEIPEVGTSAWLLTAAGVEDESAPELDERTASLVGAARMRKDKRKHSSFYTKKYSGVATHFPGAPAALACGDVWNSPTTQKFAALCHSTFDAAPGSDKVTRLNPNKSPVCGAYVKSRKSITGKWLSSKKDQHAYAVVGGDGALSCVGTAAVRCHIPRTISITRGGVTVTGVKVVDRNQGLSPSPCNPGDVDVSDSVYFSLGKTKVLGAELKGVTWTWE